MSKEKKLTDLFVNYSASIRRTVARFVNRDDIDDIVQETFVRSYEADLKQTIQYPRSYMLKTAKHLALNHLDKWDNKFKQALLDDLDAPDEIRTEQLEAQFESKERFLLFCRAANQLSGQVRTTFILKKVYGFTQKEIASYLNLSESTIEKHVANGLLKCAEYMASNESDKHTHANRQSSSVNHIKRGQSL